MQFLSASTIAIAAALTIPPLIALYFLKLRRTVLPISSTLLWKKAIEDLHVNAPFQRLRSSLLLLLQLLVLILAAIALGKPMLAREKQHEKTLILMIDQSASMAVVEENNMTRLEIAKREAKKVIDAMDEHSRAMVIAFCDRATMVSSFDADRQALKRKIDTIEQTDSLSLLAEAIALAEAYSQNMIIGGPTPGSDIEVQSSAEVPSVILFTDGRVADAPDLSPQRLDLSKMEVIVVGRRNDNVGILAMEASRNYERPEAVQVFATVRNFSDAAVTFDATLLINRQPVDVQTVRLEPGFIPEESDDQSPEPKQGETSAPSVPSSFSSQPDEHTAPPVGSVAAIAFDQVEFEDSGIVEVRLSIGDALAADNRAWTVLPPPRRVDLLLVTEGNFLLERVLNSLNVTVSAMTPDEYEKSPDESLAEGNRSRYDVVIFDRHSTARLWLGNYMFWGSVPRIDGVEELGMIDDEAIIDWDENHPILRHVPVAALNVFMWNRLKLPDDTVRLIEGETQDSTVLAYFTRRGSQYLICAFPFYFIDEDGTKVDNTDWVVRWDFVLFNADAIQYLSSSAHTGGLASLRPGEPKTISIPPRTDSVTIQRPDGHRDNIPTAAAASVTYARTRRVGIYDVDPAVEGQETFTVNLFNANESRVAPKKVFVIGSSRVAATQGRVLVNEPLWQWLVLALLVVSLIEWIVYNRRVFV